MLELTTGLLDSVSRPRARYRSRYRHLELTRAPEQVGRPTAETQCQKCKENEGRLGERSEIFDYGAPDMNSHYQAEYDAGDHDVSSHGSHPIEFRWHSFWTLA